MKNFERKSEGFIEWLKNIKSIHFAQLKNNPDRNLNIFHRMYENEEYR